MCPYTGRPSIAVAKTRALRISLSGMAMMSFDNTAKSARFPGVMDPKIFSLNDAHAGSKVIPDAEVAYFSC